MKNKKSSMDPLNQWALAGLALIAGIGLGVYATTLKNKLSPKKIEQRKKARLRRLRKEWEQERETYRNHLRNQFDISEHAIEDALAEFTLLSDLKKKNHELWKRALEK